jgi:hypothetical protein
MREPRERIRRCSLSIISNSQPLPTEETDWLRRKCAGKASQQTIQPRDAQFSGDPH